MKFDLRPIVTTASVACLLFLTACDWSSGSQENFNSSGYSTFVNVSGFYTSPTGGRVVSQTSRGNIVSLTIQQSGNRVDVTDSQGSHYSGSIGTPLLASDGTIPAGSAAATYQISFSGRDEVAAKDIEFTGVLTVVTVVDITSFDQTITEDLNTNVNSNIAPPFPDTGSGTTIDDTTSTITDSIRIYELEQNNNQLQLNGTWVELGGVTASVRAVGPPVQGNIVIE